MKIFNKQLLIWLFAFTGGSVLQAQVSDFETGIDGWLVEGDAQNSGITPTYFNIGGNPGGYIYANDDNIGGVWYWVAPIQFRGNKCNVYGNNLSYDIKTTDSTSDPFDSTDIIIEGAGLYMVFQYENLPGTTWTHYDIPMVENAGWRLNHLGGPPPTQGQFQALLSNVTRLWIRGEFIHGDDAGSLDNVVFASPVELDLDADDSSGADGANYSGDTLCLGGSSLIADIDFFFNADPGADSVVISLVFGHADGDLEYLSQATTVTGIQISGNNTEQVSLINSGSADAAAMKAAVIAVEYHHDGPPSTNGLRVVRVIAYSGCVSDTAYAFIYIITAEVAGIDTTVAICSDETAFALLSLTGGVAGLGNWTPPLHSGSDVFDPAEDAPGLYAYIVPGIMNCPADTAFVDIQVIEAPGFSLPADTVFCRDSVFNIQVIDLSFDSYTWNTGATTPALAVIEGGLYSLTVTDGPCTVSDSIFLTTQNCTVCRLYIPNVFSPNYDGINDVFLAYPNCDLNQFEMRIFDRWGELLFVSNDPTIGWDGTYRGKKADIAVYAYYARYVADSFGALVTETFKGDVMLVR